MISRNFCYINSSWIKARSEIRKLNRSTVSIHDITVDELLAAYTSTNMCVYIFRSSCIWKITTSFYMEYFDICNVFDKFIRNPLETVDFSFGFYLRKIHSSIGVFYKLQTGTKCNFLLQKSKGNKQPTLFDNSHIVFKVIWAC